MSIDNKILENEQLFSWFIKCSPIHTFIKEITPTQSKVINVSDNFIDMLGINGSDMIGKTMEELFPIEFAKKMTEDDLYVVTNNKILKIEETFNNRIYSTIKYPIFIGDKKLVAGYSIDITDMKKYEIALKESDDFNQKLIQTMPFNINIIDKHGTILFSNKLSQNNINVIGKKCWNIYRYDDQKCTDCPLFSEIEIGKTKKIESNGWYEEKIYEISHTGIMYNNDKAILEIFQDITERKNSENRLSRAEIISKTGNWELNINKQIMTASDGARKIYNINKYSEIKYKDIKKYALLEYRPLLDNALKNLIEYNKHYDVEYKIKTNNEIKIIHSVANYNKINKVVFGVIQDVTIQKQNEEALEKSNAVKSIFLSNISHELRTPMTAIIGYSDLILSNNKNKDTNRFLKSINSNAKHLDELLNNILDYSKIESDAVDILYEQFSISDLFEELYDIFEDENYKKNLNLVKLEFIKDKDKKITSDYLRLKQVLYNIISNSIKFTENGYIKVSFTSDEKYIIFKIEDTGIGIMEDQISFVFDRFWQCDSTSRKKYKGTGLGLSISKSIIELLNGEIWLESKINVGTTFYVKIPTSIEDQNQKSIINNIDFPGKKVLIVDDIPTTYSLLGIYLNSLHINIISANGGKEAIEIYKKQKEKIDIVIIDLNLFDISGFELIKTIRELCGNCKIISKSGIENKKSELVDYHLKKPINKNILFSILNDIWQK